MAAGEVVYGTRTVLPNISRVHSDVNNAATAFGEIDNTIAQALDYNIHITIPISPSATSGFYDLFLVVSQDGVEWTDGVDPAVDLNYFDYVRDARLIRTSSTVYDNTPVGARTQVRLHFSILEIFPGLAVPPYMGFVLINRSGQTIPASGADGDSVSMKISAS